jgi:hypothetical protein
MKIHHPSTPTSFWVPIGPFSSQSYATLHLVHKKPNKIGSTDTNITPPYSTCLPFSPVHQKFQNINNLRPNFNFYLNNKKNNQIKN